MPRTTTLRSLARSAATLVVALGLAGDAAAQKPPSPQQLHEVVLKRRRAELLVHEAAVLKQAYVLMAAANANYDGRRARAMQEVEAAIHALDGGVRKNGNLKQKLVAAQGDVAAARAKFLAQHAPKEKNPQVISDLLMEQAGGLLGKARIVFSANGQPRMYERTTEAVRQIGAALNESRKATGGGE